MFAKNETVPAPDKTFGGDVRVSKVVVAVNVYNMSPPALSESESEDLLSQYKFTRNCVLRCTEKKRTNTSKTHNVLLSQH